MGKKGMKPQVRRPRRWRWALAALGVIVAGVGSFWWLSEPTASGGTPRLVVDREVVDLGFLPFEAPARVVFMLTNAGDGPLRLADVPRVKVLKGC